MKKGIFCMIGMLCLTGCGTKTLNCSMLNDANEELKMTQNIITTYKKDTLTRMDMRIIVDFSDNYASYSDDLDKNLKDTYKNYEGKKGIKIDTKRKDKTVTLTFMADLDKMDNDTKKDFDLVGTGEKLSEVKADLEQQGYTCKEA